MPNREAVRRVDRYRQSFEHSDTATLATTRGRPKNGFERLGLPESVTQAVFDRMTAERKLLADKIQYEGQAEAQKIRSSAQRKADEMISSANAEAFKIRGQGEAVAAGVLPVFQQNPELATFLLKTEALESSLKERSILIFDQRTPPFDLFNSSVGKPAK